MEMYIGILIDLLLCLCILLFVIRTAKKGFALSLFNIIAFFGAFILSAFIAKNVSGYIFDTFFEQSVIDKISTSAVSIFAESTADEIKSFVSTEFPLLFNFSNLSGVGIDTAAVSGVSSATASFISSTLIKPIFVSLISLIVYIVALIISIPVLRFIGRKISKIFTVSLAGKINSVLGGFLGIIKGIIVVFIVSALSVTVMGFFLDADSPLSYGIQNSFIINYVSKIIL